MKTESTENQEKKLETLEEAAMSVLNEFDDSAQFNVLEKLMRDNISNKDIIRAGKNVRIIIGLVFQLFESKCEDHLKQYGVKDELWKVLSDLHKKLYNSAGDFQKAIDNILNAFGHDHLLNRTHEAMLAKQLATSNK